MDQNSLVYEHENFYQSFSFPLLSVAVILKLRPSEIQHTWGLISAPKNITQTQQWADVHPVEFMYLVLHSHAR